MQTTDMKAFLMGLGWTEDLIIMIDIDAGISGTKKISERPGMTRLYQLISEEQIAAVACQDEDRLFRDMSQIQVNIFIEACRIANVLVITPTMVYDFSNPSTGSYFARQFRFKSDMSAEYITSFIKVRLHGARERLRSAGKWDGSGIAPGYMVDMREMLPDGSRNENYRNFVPFEPFAEVVRRYFEVFIEHAGCISSTTRHIHEFGPYYPSTYQVPEGFKFAVYHQTQYKNGYAPTKTGLKYLLTNPKYLGYWTTAEGLVPNHHDPIVSEALFMQAFNYLSEVTLDGSPNLDYKPFHQHKRPSLDEKRSVERPLCTGMIFTKGAKAGTRWRVETQSYFYVVWSDSPLLDEMWRKKADYLDDAVVALLHEKLRSTFNPEIWEQIIRDNGKVYEAEKRRKQKELEHLLSVMRTLIANLESLKNKKMIEEAEQRYEQHQQEAERLAKELADMQEELDQIQAICSLKDAFEPALENWSQMTREEKQRVLHVFIKHIEATPIEKAGLILDIVWGDNTTDQVVLPRQATNHTQWLVNEVNLLLKLVEANASQLEIAATFPQRTWEMIHIKLWYMGITVAFEEQPIKYKETYPMYMERINNPLAHPSALPGSKWSKQETNNLLVLLETSITKMQLAEAFPARTWTGIRRKITELKGKEFKVPGEMILGRNETHLMRQSQTQHALECVSSDECTYG